MTLARQGPTPTPSGPPATIHPTASTSLTPGAAPPPDGITFTDFAVDISIVRSPTTSTAQSKLWFADGRWWGALFGPTSDRLGIFSLDPATQVWADTGTLIDERPVADADMLWTGTHLYAVSGGSRPSLNHAIHVRRFSYDAKTKRFTMDPDFPVTLRPTGASPAVIAIDSSGMLWVAYVADSTVWVQYAPEAATLWSDPVALPAPEATVEAGDVASIIAFGPGRVGVAWTNQRSGVHFSVHEDGAPPEAWSPPETILPGARPDQQLNLATYPAAGDATSVAAAVATTHDSSADGRTLDALTLLASRAGDADWSTAVVGLVRDRHTRPIVLVDPDERTIAVAATSPGAGGAIYYKRTPLDRVEFDTGIGTPLIASQGDTTIDSVTSAKGPLTAESGLLALASDRTSGRYLHGIVPLGGAAPAADPADPARPKAPTAPPKGTTDALLRDTFEPWPAGPATDVGWSAREEDPPGRLAIVPDGRGQSLRVSGAGAGVRACREFADIPGASLAVSARLRLSRVARDDATILSVRGSGGEAASIRVTDKGVLAWFDGRTKIRTSIVFRPRTWYRISARIDQARKRYDVRVTTDGGRLVARANGLRWRARAVPSVRSVCVETAPSPPRQVIDLSEVNVSQVVTP
jgi:hypothetical protein